MTELRFTRPAYVTVSAYLSIATAILLLAGLAWWTWVNRAGE